MEDTSLRRGDEAYDPDRPTEKLGTSIQQNSTQTPLRYRRKSLWILAIYVILLVLPWVADCVLMYQSFNTAGYHQRLGLSPKNVLDADGWLSAAAVIAKIQTVVAIPIVSGLLAEAAVVYSQRRVPDQKLSMRQLLALADRSWADIPGYWKARHRDIGSRLVWLGGLLILLVSVQPPLQSILVGNEAVQVVTCLDTPIRGCDVGGIDEEVGFDPEPSDMQYLPSAIPVQRVSSKILSVNDMDAQPYLWPEQWINIDDADRAAKSTLFWYYDAFLDSSFGHYSFFASALTNGTNTGVLRQLAMRMNSTSGCTNVARSDFPTTCLGKRPFTSNLSIAGMEVNICAPGAYDEIPWTLSRDRQDITEDLWIDVFVDYESAYNMNLGMYYTTNFTLHCTTDTTRGYFEVPNVRTNGNPGPLLEKWPSVEEMERDWNDYLGVGSDYAIPTVVDNYTDEIMLDWRVPISSAYTYPNPIAPGPLMLSVLAMFGNTSWWNTVSNTSTNDTISQGLQAICQTGSIPFTTLNSLFGFEDSAEPCLNLDWRNSDEQHASSLGSIVYSWLAGFNTSEGAIEALGASTYFANEAVLTATAQMNWAFSSKWIYYSSGLYIVRPYKSLGGLITITILIGLQLAALIYVAWYVHSTPVWTAKFDSYAMARIGAEIERTRHADLAPTRYADEKDLVSLKKVDGMIGVLGEDRDGTNAMDGERDMSVLPDGVGTDHTKQSASVVAREGNPNIRRRGDGEAREQAVLGVGGPGVIGKGLARKKTKKRNNGNGSQGATIA